MTNRRAAKAPANTLVFTDAFLRIHTRRAWSQSIKWLLVTFILVMGSAIAQQTIQIQGSVPIPEIAGTLALTLDDAIRMALRQNLAAIECIQADSSLRGQRLLALSKLLPAIEGSVSEHVIQSSLVPYGIDIPGVPTISGPYQYQDARLNYRQTLFSASSIQNLRSAKRSEQAATLSIADVREAIVLMTGAAYLGVLQASSHVLASTAEVDYASALHTQAVNAFRAGTGARIDETRTAVQLDTERYNLVQCVINRIYY